MASSNGGGSRLKSASGDLFSTLGERAMSSVGDKVSGLTEKLEGVASGNPSAKAAVGSAKSTAEGDGPVKGALKGAASAVKDKIPGLGGGSGGSGSGSPKATKATNIIEQVDVGVPVRVAYNQWTEFGGFPTFMKKVETVDAQEDNKIEWKAQIFWSHRHWKATILEQVPDERIVWRSSGEKGHVDGAVTFHELGPNLTRILVVLEYYPQGLFEKTGNLWRAQGRRARVELKHFRRHVMTRTILDPDEVEGWRGTIEDSEVVETHEEALEREESEEGGSDEGASDEGGSDEGGSDEGDSEEYEDEPEDEYSDEPEDEAEDDGEYADEEESEDESEDEYADEEPEDEVDDEAEDEYADEEAEDEESEDEESDDAGEPEDGYEDEDVDSEDEYEDDGVDEAEDEEEAEAEPEDEDEYEEAEPDEGEVEDEEAEQDEEEAPRPRSRRKRAS